MIRRVLYFLAVTLVLGGLAGGIGYYAFEFKPKFLAEIILGSPQPPTTVAAEAARSDSWQPQISGIGTLAAVDGIFVTPQVGGIIEDIRFDSGQEVKQGQVLVVLDTDTEKADLRSLEAQQANVKTELARKETLVLRGISAPTEVDRLRTETLMLSANIDRLKAQIAQKSVAAPWDGTLGLREVSLGSNLAPGQNIVWLQKIDPVFADFSVTEADFGRIKVMLKVTASFDAWPGESFTGEIVTLDARMSDQSRMITVRAKFSNPQGRLLPGMYADIVVDAGVPETVVTVPQTAVTFSLYGDNVFVVVPASKSDPNAKADELAIERRFIKVGPVRDNRVQIVSGLAPGERVVTAGHNKIDQGSRVVINNSVALKALESETTQ